MEIDPKDTTIVVFDFYDYHWCKTIQGYLDDIAPRLNMFLKRARDCGCLVAHCPAGLKTEFYKNHPRFKILNSIPRPFRKRNSKYTPWNPVRRARFRKKLRRRRCACSEKPCKPGKPWTQQHPEIKIEDTDFIPLKRFLSHYLMRVNEIGKKRNTFLYTGGALDGCMLRRTNSIGSMLRVGYQVFFVKDLTFCAYCTLEETPGSMSVFEKEVCSGITTDELLSMWEK